MIHKYGPVPLSELGTSAGRGKALRALIPQLRLTDEQTDALASVEPTPEWKWLGLPGPPDGEDRETLRYCQAEAERMGWTVPARPTQEHGT